MQETKNLISVSKYVQKTGKRMVDDATCGKMIQKFGQTLKSFANTAVSREKLAVFCSFSGKFGHVLIDIVILN